MNKDRYLRWINISKEHPSVTKIVIVLNKTITYLCYVLYPLLLVWLAFSRREILLRCILVPGSSFVLLSVFRRLVNKQRPYEKYGFTPVISKDTTGKSFPSRHTFSVFVIACTFMLVCPAAGIIMLIWGIIMGIVRVLGGVHFPADVLAGGIFGVISAIIGYIVIPLLTK